MRHAVVLAIGGSLGAGPWQCSPTPWPDPGAGSGSSVARPAAPPFVLGPPPAAPPVPAPAPPAPRPAAPPIVTPPSPSPAPAAPKLTPAPRRDEPTVRETLGTKKPPAAGKVAFADEVIVGAVRVLQPTFTACWRRAQRNDPSLTTARVRLYLEVDPSGAVSSSRTDAEDELLDSCLAKVSRRLAFPAPGKPVALEIPLYF